MLVLAIAFPISARVNLQSADVNGDGVANISDVTDLIGFLLNGPDDPGEDYVDLGLPTGTLWATRNVGAVYPEDFGYYFAWGDINPDKEYFWWETTPWVTIVDNKLYFTKYNTDSNLGTVDNKTELDLEDDAAYVNYPDGRMPSKEEIDELVDNCTWEWTEVNGVKGQLITGPNGNTMFLPAAGYFLEYSVSAVGVSCHYWSRSLLVLTPTFIIPNSAYTLMINEQSLAWSSSDRDIGHPVRAVRR